MSKAREERRREWGEEIAAWRQSGETMSAWSRKRGLSRDALQYWKRKFDGGELVAERQAPLQLIRVGPELARGHGRRQSLELVIDPAGLRVVVPEDFDVATLSRLLDVVVSRC